MQRKLNYKNDSLFFHLK